MEQSLVVDSLTQSAVDKVQTAIINLQQALIIVSSGSAKDNALRLTQSRALIEAANQAGLAKATIIRRALRDPAKE